MVTVFINAFCIVSERRSMTPVSRARLPNISAPMSGVADGNNTAQVVSTVMGKRIFSSLETGRSCTIFILRSSSVVSRRMIGGWMIGTRAM